MSSTTRTVRPIPTRTFEHRPRCECQHDSGPFGPIGCEQVATLRVTVVCVAEGCDEPAATHLACEDCGHAWVLAAEADPGAPALEVTPL